MPNKQQSVEQYRKAFRRKKNESEAAAGVRCEERIKQLVKEGKLSA